jgi:Phage integrase, N-terminal SAM-like domain
MDSLLSWLVLAAVAGVMFKQREYRMSPLRMRMIEDLVLAGLAKSTQAVYVEAVRRLGEHYGRSPDTLTEKEVRGYLVGMRERGVARGTFKANHFGIQFFYRHTLNRDWALFSKKRFGSLVRSACRLRSLTPRYATSLAA